MKVLLVPAIPRWAFDNRAKDITSLSFKKVKFSMKYAKEVTKNDLNYYDIIYPMSPTIARRLNNTGIPYHKMATSITSVRLYENQMINNRKFKDSFLHHLQSYRGINAWSNEIINTFKPHHPIYKTRIGINHKLFKPIKKKQNKKFTIGWVGRIDKENYRELKGYDIVLEALKDLNVNLDIRTFTTNYVPREKMVEFYQGLDCFICSSKTEGLPNPVLEAASCGVPIISTNVGFVPEIIQHDKNGLIVPRTSAAIRKAVQELRNNPKKRDQFSKNIRKTVVKHWTWGNCKTDWEKFFLSLKK
ncbi:glycosyltransferase involved in cell wall biosynthesis [Salibacterium salarium]|uniref:glycosyltransferase family 4 protein n=1 Tax=Salibacterium salarium TaxID=284579 RepID=UPI002780CDC9|nr:glycosyltransferase family 4 protein [Salibacterium salarium]MDQ0300699.1 glycosyltransferase involved in cell wall biosynthesis [Salibacterium salarium]